jgi:hypothetical protein
LKFLLLHSPNWLFLYPGILLTVIGLVMMLTLLVGPMVFGRVSFDINTLLFGDGFLTMGINMMFFAFYTKVYAAKTKYIPMTKSIEKMSKFTTEKGVGIGFILLLIGIAASVSAVVIWGQSSFGSLNPNSIMRVTIPAVTLCTTGMQLIFGGFFIGILQMDL